MNNLTEVTKFRESQYQQHRKEDEKRKQQEQKNKRIIGRQT